MADDAKGNNARRPGKLVSAALEGAKSLMSRERAFRRVCNDLSVLSDAELDALGLSRKMIRPVARQAALAA